MSKKIRRPIPGSGKVYSSTDYEAGELITLAEACNKLVGKSALGVALNAGMKPHNMLGASMIGMLDEEYSKRAKEPVCKDARQAAKCYHPDTEVLTKRGWIKVNVLTMADWVAAAEPHKEGISIVWQQPTALTSRSSPGYLIHLKNEGMDLRVTDDHPMLIRRQGGRWDLTTPEKTPTARGWANAGTGPSGSWAPDERLLRLAVATQADGSFSNNRIRFGFVKPRKGERLRELLATFEGHWNEGTRLQADTSTGVVYDFRLSAELSEKIRAMLDADKQFTWHWLELTQTLRETALEESLYWDGHRPAKCRSHVYDSAQMQNVDVLQALATLSNRKTRAVTAPRKTPRHAPMTRLTIRAKPDTRGGSLECTRIPYEGDVYCLSVPAGFIVVRDGGIPVIGKNCANFGFPGGAGAATLVLQSRKGGIDTPCPNGPHWIEDENGNKTRGYKGLRFCILMDKAEACGIEKTTQWRERMIPPTCVRCIECALRLKTFWQGQWPEMKMYFDYIQECVEQGMLITAEMLEWWPHLKPWYTAGERLAPGEIMQLVSGRVRGGVTFTQAANSFFQGLLADACKAALRQCSRECYDNTVVVAEKLYPNSKPSKYAGGKSPLFGSRAIVFAHDEIIFEHPEDIAHDAVMRVSEVMVSALRHYCPTVADACAAEPTLMRKWHKSATKVVHRGRVVPWTPEHDSKTCTECDHPG